MGNNPVIRAFGSTVNAVRVRGFPAGGLGYGARIFHGIPNICAIPVAAYERHVCRHSMGQTNARFWRLGT